MESRAGSRVVPTRWFWGGMAFMVALVLLTGIPIHLLVGNRMRDIVVLDRRGIGAEGRVVQADAVPLSEKTLVRVEFSDRGIVHRARRSYAAGEVPRIGARLAVRYLPEDARIAVVEPLGPEIARREAAVGRAWVLTLLTPIGAAVWWGVGLWRDRRWLQRGVAQTGHVVERKEGERPELRVEGLDGTEHRVRLKKEEPNRYALGQAVTLLILDRQTRVAEGIMWARRAS